MHHVAAAVSGESRERRHIVVAYNGDKAHLRCPLHHSRSNFTLEPSWDLQKNSNNLTALYLSGKKNPKIELSSTYSLSSMEHDEFSVLKIENVCAEHVGKYICTIYDQNTEAKTEFFLSVLGKWIT